MATAAHAIREAARARAEGRGYEPEPPLFELDTHSAKASPGTLLIANPSLSGREEPSREPSEERINTSSARRPGDWAIQRPDSVFPKSFPVVPQFCPTQEQEHPDTTNKSERSRSPTDNTKTKPVADLAANSGTNAKQRAPMDQPTGQAPPGRAKAPYPKMHPKLPGKSCQHLVPPKVAGPRQASSTAQGQPAPGKFPLLASENREHPGHMLVRFVAIPPEPVGVPHTPPEAWSGPRYTFEEWTRQAAMREDEQAMHQAKEQREQEERQKATAKAKPHQVQQFPKVS